jgi:hypothetical protein
MRRVLLISPHFPPDTSAASHRVRLLAPYLEHYGWEPTIVAVEPEGYEGRLDPDLAAIVPGSLRVVRAPAWPVHVTRRFGIGDLGVRAMTGLRRVASDLLGRERFDALFITVYPTYPALLGPALKRRFDVPFVLDYQDPWVGAWGRDVGPGGVPDVKSRLSRALAERLEPIAVRAADGITAVSERTYRDVLARVTDARPRACAAIPLGADAGDFAALARTPRANPIFDPSDRLAHICYVGTALPHGTEVMRAVCGALAQLRRQQPSIYARLRLHFIGTSNQRDVSSPLHVMPLAAACGVADVVTEHPARLDYLDALNVQATASAILLLGSREPHYTPSKVYPALLSGRPLIAVYHRQSPVVELLAQQPGVAVMTFDDAQPVEASIDCMASALSAVVDGTLVRGTSSGDAIDEFSTTALAGRLAGVLDTVSA